MSTTLTTSFEDLLNAVADGRHAFAKQLLLLASLAVGTCSSVAAQQATGFFERLGIEQGLSQGTVTAITQDAQGFLWIGTQAGLNRYDGYGFRSFGPTPGEPGALSDGYINALLTASNGSIWIGTDSGGLNRFDPMTGRFSAWRSEVGARPRLSSNRVLSLLRDRSGALWVGTERGLDRFEPSRGAFTHMSGNSGAVFSLIEDSAGRLWAGTARGLFLLERATEKLVLIAQTRAPVRAVEMTTDDRLWLGTGDGLARFDIAAGTLAAQSHPLAAVPGGAQVRALLQDSSGGLWVATRAGLARRDSGGTWSAYRHGANDAWSLPQNVIFTLFEDRQGVVWAGTYGGGLARYAPWKNAFRRYLHDPDTQESLAQNIIFPIHEDRAGMLWIGTYNRGLDRLDPTTGRVAHYAFDADDASSLSGDEVRAILEDTQGRLWIGTNHTGLNLLDRQSDRFIRFRHDPDDSTSLGYDRVVALLEGVDGQLWVGTWGGGLDRLDPATGVFEHYRHDRTEPTSLSHDRVMALHQDEKGTLWIATDGGGLNRFDPRTEKFERYRHRPDDPDSLSHDTIEHIHEDARGRLWLATRYGLNRFDPATGRFERYLARDGLADNLVMGVLGDANGDLWISTSRGLSRLDLNAGTFRNYFAVDGLGVDEFNSFAHHPGRDGTLYFGGMHGVLAFRPDEITVSDPLEPVVLTGLRLFNQEVEPQPGRENALLTQDITRTESLTLAHHQSIITFEFASLNLASAGRMQYAYRLEGLDEDWLETDATRRFATYTYLPSGQFRFLVRARTPGGEWSPATVLALTVQPPPWRTGWAYALYAAAALLLLAGVYRYYRQRTIAAQLERERDAAERAARVKSEFLAVMSHEIRTPLNGVLGVLELLRTTRLTGRQRGYVENIHHAGQGLVAILDDVLDYSRIEAERISFELTNFELRPLLDGLVMLLSVRAAQKQLALDVQVERDVPAFLRSDPGRLRQVLLNLLGNAVKFTQQGSVCLLVRQLAEQNGRARLRFEITDTGPGIASARQAHLFQNYTQADASISRRYGGSGLGLAICRRLVEAQDGCIGVDSQLGEGATFWFELDFDVAAAEVNEPVESAVAMIDPLRVLLVDDVEMNRAVAIGMLRLDGHSVEAAMNGRQALERLSKKDFDLILMDVRMREMDGLEAARRIRELPDVRKATIRIIGLTASVEPEAIRRCLDAGMNHVLRKPLTLAALRAALTETPAATAETTASTHGNDARSPLLDELVLRGHRQALGMQRLHDIVERFKDNSGKLLASSREALAREDASVIREAAHLLAGAAGGLGCVRLHECANAIEQDASRNAIDAQALHALEICFRDSLAAVSHALIAFEREAKAVQETAQSDAS